MTPDSICLDAGDGHPANAILEKVRGPEGFNDFGRIHGLSEVATAVAISPASSRPKAKTAKTKTKHLLRVSTVPKFAESCRFSIHSFAVFLGTFSAGKSASGFSFFQ